MKHIAFSCGDTNGIGPEICIKAISKLSKNKNNKFILSIPPNVFNNYSNLIDFQFADCSKITKQLLETNQIIIEYFEDYNLSIGIPTEKSGAASIYSINRCLELIDNGFASGIITAPISKFAISLAGINFIGHTELIASRYNVEIPVMTFLSRKLKCALATIHIPIKDISISLDYNKLLVLLTTIKNSLTNDFGVKYPQIGLLGLNPHAGENGKIGDEELNILNPLVNSLDYVKGPFVPDAYFGNKIFKQFDLTLGLYHDQVLIPFKYIAFDSGVNFTAGLPIVRTSPDHGTAFDIAGKNIANANSIIEAYKWAKLIIKNRQKNVC